MTYYLDANAHVSLNLSQEQIQQINNEYGIHGNPYSANLLGRKAAELVEKSRDKIAELLGAEDSSNIIFTNSCTESNYWACLMLSNFCMINEYYQSEEKDLPKINISPYEHRTVDDCMPLLPFDKDTVLLNNNGKIKNIKQNDHSIFVGVQNEIGIIADFKKIRENTKLIFISDLAQAVGKIPIDLKNMGVDIATFGAHKFGGPNGVGIIYVKDANLWCPINNCKSYRQDVPGSINTIGIYQTAVALENAIKDMQENNEIANEFKMALENGLTNLGFEIIGKDCNRTETTTLAKVPNGFGLELMLDLEEHDIIVSLGSACGSREKQPLKSAMAIGHDCILNTECIRISHNGKYYSKDAIFICEKIANIIKGWK